MNSLDISRQILGGRRRARQRRAGTNGRKLALILDKGGSGNIVQVRGHGHTAGNVDGARQGSGALIPEVGDHV